MASFAVNLIVLVIVVVFKLVQSEFLNEIPDSGSRNIQYEMGVINFPRRHARSLDYENINLQFNAYGETINLNLRNVSRFLYGPNTPVHKIFTDKQQPVIMAQNGEPIAYQRTIYEDLDHFATFTVDTFPNGSRIIQSANIGTSNLTIFPAPLQYLQQPSRVLSVGNGLSNQYIFYRSNDLITVNIDVKIPSNIVPVTQPPNYRVVQIPHTLYIEILIIVDYPLLNKIGPDTIISYLITFWNQVDILYRVLSQPLYKINIAGIVIPQDGETLGYFYKDPTYGWISQNFEFKGFLSNSAKWLYKHQKFFPLGSYDIAVTMTSRKDPVKWTPLGYKSSAGVSYLGKVCQINHYSKEIHNTAIVFDDGSFAGIPIAAHEVGHLLGANHDNRPPCSDTDGFIMASFVSQTSNRFKWSPCSIKDFKNIF